MKPTISEECAQDVSPPPTTLLTYNPQGITEELREHPHWLVCDFRGRPVKRPGIGSSKTNPKHWKDFATASRISESEPGLLPYLVLTEDSPFTVFDVDFKPRREGGRKAETLAQFQERIQRAKAALERLRGDFPERYESRSKSGNGFHLIVRGKFHGTGGKGKDEWSDVEIYTKDHGVALTGHIWQGHDDPAPYPDATLQGLRDTIKGGAPRPDSAGEAIDRRSHGNVKPEWARQVLAELARLHGRPDRDDWRNMSSAVFDGVGVEMGIELLEEVWPEEKRGEYRILAKSLPRFVPWGTLNGFLKGSELSADDPTAGFADLTKGADLIETSSARKRLADFRVDHTDTLGMSWQEIDALRPPYIIDGFIRHGEVLLLGAESKSRKSWLTQDAAFSVSSGLPWLADENGAHGFSTVQARVHIFDLELNPAEMRYRFAKARGNRFAESPEDAAAMTAKIVAYSFDGRNVKEIMQRLEELKATVQPGDLVIVDCLYGVPPKVDPLIMRVVVGVSVC